MKIIKARITKTKNFLDVCIDDEDFPKVCGFLWTIDLSGGYAIAQKRINGKHLNYKMHQVIFGKKKGFEVDHINRNKLDNRKENLRFVTHHENCLNRKRGVGIRYREDRKRWYARVKWKNKEVYLGSFKTKTEALKAREIGAIQFYGQYAFV